jgi:phosphotransacetylase|uniref:Bifunctional enoyl-CoA hydratase/phosphate acetyltransferase n=1 Tax=Leptospirillum ferriphilum TaxID=178606 RepID=A0A7C3QSY4_9BACT
MATSGLFDRLINEALQYPPLPVAVVDPEEVHVLEAILEATRGKLLRPVLVGAPNRIREFYTRLPELTSIPVEDGGDDPVSFSVKLYHTGQVSALVKGHVPTAELLHGFLKQLNIKERLSHIFIAELSSYPKLLFITDAAINIAPDLETKADILRNAIELARKLGINLPKVAVLSAIEFVNPAIPSTIDAACLAKMSERGQIRNAIVDGPLAFDNAISLESSTIKRIHSPVSGDVDILLVPDMVSGNILAKDLEYLAGATLAGLVVGAGSVPIILNSRSDSPRSRLVSCAVASLAFHRQTNKGP